MICFQIVSLTYWFTANWLTLSIEIRLWFAFRLYLWLIDSQHIKAMLQHAIVVICFQIVSLTYWFTASNHSRLIWLPLWFAFRLYLWLIDSQQHLYACALYLCCDLLSDCIFDLLIHSRHKKNNHKRTVVICFQIVSLTYWFTAEAKNGKSLSLLWFAFRLYLWLIDSQQTLGNIASLFGCDLLSDCIFDLLIHSGGLHAWMSDCVVICFQIVSLTYWFTANSIPTCCNAMLWFAFRLYLWLIDSQHRHLKMYLKVCCDLLSDCIFDLLIHSSRWAHKPTPRVVICFQIVSLTYWFTASSISAI